MSRLTTLLTKVHLSEGVPSPRMHERPILEAAVSHRNQAEKNQNRDLQRELPEALPAMRWALSTTLRRSRSEELHAGFGNDLTGGM